MIGIGIGLGIASTALGGGGAPPAGPVVSLAPGATGYAGSEYRSTIAGQWTANDSPIPGQTGTTLAMTPALEGAAIRCGDSNTIEMWVPLDASPQHAYNPSLASSLTVVGGAVSAIADGGSGSMPLAQSTGSAQPTSGSHTIGGVPVLGLDGGDILAKSAAPYPQPGANDSLVGCVFDIQSFSANAYMVRGTVGATTRFGLLYDITAGGNYRFVHDATYATALVPRGEPGSRVVVGHKVGTALTIRENGGSASGTGTTTGSGPTLDGFTIGGGLTGGLGEAYAWLSYPGDDTRDRLEGYLAHKYGLADRLPEAHPYKTVSNLRAQ